MSDSDTVPGLQDSDFKRDGRLLSINSRLGADRLLLTSLTGEEGISRLFRFDLELLSRDTAITPEQLVGTPVACRISWTDREPRYLHGYVSRFGAGALDPRGFRSYRAEIVPWLWFLSRTTDCRIFQHKSIPDIVKDVFSAFGFTDFAFKLQKEPYPQLEFCVQYRETALNFVSRLLETAGISYFVHHDATRHTLVLSDANVFFTTLQANRFALSDGEIARDMSELVTAWEHDWEFTTGRWTQKDYDFESPSHDLTAAEKTIMTYPRAGNFERFDYPGGYTDLQRGKELTRTLIEAEEARHHLVRGASQATALEPGRKFLLASHPIPSEQGKEYAVLTVRHEARDTSYFSGMAPASHYANTFEVIDAKVPYRPARLTPKPFVQGPQTAVVVGPAAETIHTDKYGRVKLHFHWDRQGKHDDSSSCWVRVSQAWAGSGWGGVTIPHVGHEVVVSFLEGDPDRPLVTGRVYNGENRKAVNLPGDKTQSAMRDHTGNEIVMEGKQGSQDIRIHAVKDMNTTVDNDSNMVVHGKFTHNVTTLTARYHVMGALTEIYDNTQSTTVKSDITVVSTGGAVAVSSESRHVYVNAATSIQLHVGQSMIWMDKGGQIRIQGVDVTVLGTSSVTIKGGIVHSEADSEHQTKGAIVLSEGKATNTVRGGMVMLNP